MKSAARCSAAGFCAAAMLAAAAPPMTRETSVSAQIVTDLQARDAAVATAGYRLAVGAAGLCPHGWASGVSLQRLSQYSAAFRPAARARLKIGDLPSVAAVVPGSAAAAAWLRVGDEIAAIDGVRVDPAPPVKAEADFAPTAAALDLFDRALADGAATLDLIRDGGAVRVTLTAARACPARFDVRTGNAVNAYSDGLTVQVASRLVDFARGEGELAAIVAHELAHNILGHPARLADRTPGRARLSVRASEIEADRLSVYLLALAGYPPEDAAAFWRRFGRAHGPGIFGDPDHPGWRKRVASLEREAAAIRAMQARGEAIVPPPDLQPQPSSVAK